MVPNASSISRIRWTCLTCASSATTTWPTSPRRRPSRASPTQCGAWPTYAKGSGVTVIVESHGDFTDSPSLLDLLKQAGDGVALLWDTHHTYVDGKEKPADTFAALGSYVRHTHIKDSVPAGAERHYVLTGKGDVPIADIVRTLVTGGYTGYYCFEWEKAWHPDIDEPEVAIPDYASAMRGYLTNAGWKGVTGTADCQVDSPTPERPDSERTEVRWSPEAVEWIAVSS